MFFQNFHVDVLWLKFSRPQLSKLFFLGSHGLMSFGHTRTDDACVEYRQVLLARGEGCDGKRATGLCTATDPSFRR